MMAREQQNRYKEWKMEREEDRIGKGLENISPLIFILIFLSYIISQISTSYSVSINIYDSLNGGYVDDYINFTSLPSNFSFNLTLGATHYNITNITLNLSTPCFYEGYQYAERNTTGKAQSNITFYNYSEGVYNLFNWKSMGEPIKDYPILDNFTYTWGLFNFSFTSPFKEGKCEINISVNDAYDYKESSIKHLNFDTIPPRLYINSTNADEEINTTNILHINISYYDLFFDKIEMLVVFNGTNSSFKKGQIIYVMENKSQREENLSFSPHTAYIYQQYDEGSKVNATSIGYLDKGKEAWIVGYLYNSSYKKAYLVFNKSTQELKDVIDYNSLNSLASSLNYNSYFIPTLVVYNNKTKNFYEINDTKTYNLSSINLGPTLEFRRVINNNYSVLFVASDYFGHKNETSLYFKINDTNKNALPQVFITSLKNNETYLNGTIDITYRPVDMYAYNITNCSLLVNGSSVSTNTTIYWNITNHFYYLFKAENYKYNYINISLICWNDLSRSYTTPNISVRFTAMPQLSFINLSLSPLNYKKDDKVVFDAYIINNGTVTSPETNLTYCFSSSPSCSSPLNITNLSIPSLRPGEYVEIKAYQNITSDGTFYARFDIDKYNSIEEYNEYDNNLTRQVSTYLTIKIINVYNSGGGHNMFISPGSLVNITINVSTYEGIPITGILKENITMHDWWKGNESVMQYQDVKNVGNPLAVYEGGNGIYNVTYKIRNKIEYDTSNHLYYYEYGYHFVNFTVVKDERRGDSNSFIYREKAPYIIVKIFADDDTIAVGGYTSLTVEAKNIGNEEVKNLTIRLLSSDDDILSFSSSSADDDKVCEYKSTLKPNGSYVLVCEPKVYGRGVGEKKIYIKQDANTFYYLTKKIFLSPAAISVAEEKITVVNTSSSSSSSSSSTSSTSQSSSQTTSQQTTTKKKGYVYSLILENDQTSFSFEEGNYKVVVLKFENTGNGTLSNLEVTLSHPQALKVVVISKMVNIAPKKEGEVKLNVTSSTSGVYTLTINIKNKNINKKYSLTFTVQPKEEEKEKINQSYMLLKEEIDSIKEEIGEKDKEKYTFFVNRLKEIKQLIDKGDYITAKQEIEELNNTLEAFKKEIKAKESAINWKVIIIVIFVIVAVAGGILYYLWTPPKMEYEPFKGYSYTPAKKEEREGIKGWIEKIKDKIKGKEEGKKEGKFAYRYKY